ncbi:hypothetical protein [Serratia sp. M24T3]|nr:hypothetical protein [Serratia sp. M24T3]
MDDQKEIDIKKYNKASEINFINNLKMEFLEKTYASSAAILGNKRN